MFLRKHLFESYYWNNGAKYYICTKEDKLIQNPKTELKSVTSLK